MVIGSIWVTKIITLIDLGLGIIKDKGLVIISIKVPI